MKTATIERYHLYGTCHHHLRVLYRGSVLNWTMRDAQGYYQGQAYADAMDVGAETVNAMIGHASRNGFTHVRFAGDWKGRTVRKTMKIKPANPKGALC